MGKVNQKDLKRELFYLKMVEGNAHFVQLYGIIMGEGEIQFVMEYVAGGCFYDFLHMTKEEKLTYSNAIELLRQAAEVCCLNMYVYIYVLHFIQTCENVKVYIVYS